MVRVSLIVPTYNRANYLKESIPSFLKQSLDKKLYEILIVDNNSDDATKEVVFDLMKNSLCSWSYILENRQGLHYARNRGILESKGDIIVFGDDDIVASEGWLEKIFEEFCSNDRAGIVGGKIVPIWEGEPPAWIYDYGTREIHSVFSYLDYGEKRFVLDKESLMGCNFSIRRDLAIKIGGSYPDTFPKHLKYLSGSGEWAMVNNVKTLNYEVVYLPEAWVYHHAGLTRATVEYFVDRYERWAIENVYHCFRKNKKWASTKSLLKESIFNLIKLNFLQLRNFFCANKLLLNKVDPKKFILIQKKFNFQVIRQVFRILNDYSLYEYVIKENYFD